MVTSIIYCYKIFVWQTLWFHETFSKGLSRGRKRYLGTAVQNHCIVGTIKNDFVKILKIRGKKKKYLFKEIFGYCK